MIGAPVVIEAALDGRLGDYDRASNTIRLDPRLTPYQRRSTLAHEWEHWRLRHSLSGDLRTDQRMEGLAARLAARRLVDLVLLGDAAACFGYDVRAVAQALGVDIDTLTLRLMHLTWRESRYLRRRLEDARENG